MKKLKEKLDVVLFVLFAALLAGAMLSINSVEVRPISEDDESSLSQLWNIETVVGEPGGWYNSLALDNSGNPHMSYYRSYGYFHGDLMYAFRTGSYWRFEYPDWSGADVGEFNSLDLDSAGNPHISYLDRDNGNLKYAYWTGSNWNTQTVDSDGFVGAATSLALDSSGNAHISYVDWTMGPTFGDLKYARWLGGWDIQTVDTGNVSWRTSLALDADGYPHISYGDYWQHVLKHARWTGSDWLIQTVDVGGENEGNSLALDSKDRPHIAYYDDANKDLKYARWTGSTWVIETVDSFGGVGLEPSIAVDAEGRPHISYRWDYGGLKYARWSGSKWWVQNVDSRGSGSSLVLDAENRPHISYYGNEGLKYAWLDLPALTLDKSVTSSGDLLDPGTLTYTLNLSGSGVRASLRDPLPSFLHYVEDSVTPPAVYSPTIRAIVWDGFLPDDPQLIRFQAQLDVAALEPPTRPHPIVNRAWLTDTENGRIVTAETAITVWPVPLLLRKGAAPCDGVRNIDTVTYTLTLSSADFNVRLWDPLPVNVQYVSGTLTGTLTPPAVYSSTARAVIWKGLLPSSLQEIRFQITPGITDTESLSLSLPILNTAWLTETESGVSVRATMIVNGWRTYLPLLMRQR